MKLYASYLSKFKLIILTVFVISCKIMFVDHAHQLKDGYKTKFCSFELKSPQMGGFIKNKHAK
ncbi:hypothetical protein BK751_20430 [Bacillus thuringiensis serovar galleriae]|nr:hypothetical protein BK701_20080 [Bacillus thuringiensis serovar amagiensis]OTY53384.1 hypothetical protein BK747_29275 [Bacillus thuringiensis serovar azorensis]OTY85745.1 hypothetical protein BK751_20430 [Bacillus thuringiensis serovar galleriae]OTZ50208.1 hypothetical protein BK766_23195 [Bacillus thuringiensis serovar wuhanensis]